MPAVTLPLADYRPDAAALEGGSSVVSGVYPISPKAYGPLQTLSQQATAGAAAPPLQDGLHVVGGFGVGEDLTTGNVQVYSSAVGSSTFQQVSGGTFVNCGTNLLTTSDHVSFAQFKNWMCAAANFSGVFYQSLSATGGTAFTKATGAPAASYCAAINNFLFVGNTNDGTAEPYRVWWPAINDPTNWPTPGSASAQAVQSDYNDFNSDLGVVSGLCGQVANADGLVFLERAVQRAIYTGPPGIFAFQGIEGAPGTPAPYSIIRNRGYAYYYGQNGFVMTDGASVKPIGAGRVDNYVMTQWEHNIWHLRGAWNDRLKCCMWAIVPKGTADDEMFSLMLLYSPDFDKWTVLPVSSAYGGIRSFCQGLAKYGSASMQVGAFLDANWNYCLMGGDILNASVTNIAATVSTGETQPIPGARAFVRNARPQADTNSATVAITYRDRLGDTQTTGSAVSMTSTGSCPQRVNGRFLSAQIGIPTSATWTHVEGVEIEAVPGGMR